ncbi:MAG: hypothetical protein DRJ49_01985 [Thermoprotei archaeon]|nr:MAG: hypothetical protein DRJ49_01985 [Thermoprotei archaeon]
MTVGKRLRVGVIGVGIQGEVHVKAYKDHPSVDLVAIADIRVKRAKEVAEKYTVKGVYESYEEMLDREELDLVSVVTPDFLHKDPVISALEHGVNVIVEKPLATNVKDAEDMVKTAKRMGLLLYTNFANRWNPPFVEVKRQFENGEMGDPVHAYIRLSDTIYVPIEMIKWSSRTNVAFFLMSHTVDLVRWIFGDEISKVRALSQSKVLNNMGVNTSDIVIALLEFYEGATAVLESCWILPNTLPSMVEFSGEFIGTEGVAFVSTTYQGVSISTSKFHIYPSYLVAAEINNRFVGFVKESIHHVVDCIIGEKQPIISPEDGLAVVKVLCAILESSSSGGSVVTVGG